MPLSRLKTFYPSHAAKLDHVVDSFTADGTIVGASILLLQDGEIAYQRFAGSAVRETQKRVDAETLFRLASLTKLATSLAVLACIARGVLRFTDKVTQYLDYFRPSLPDGIRPPITIHHLLTHTAGLSYGFEQGETSTYRAAGISDGLDGGNITLDENLRRLARKELHFAPGSAWQYSLATDVLGAVLERVRGESLPAIIDELVLAPLGLRNTCFAGFDPNRLAAQYVDAVPAPRRMATVDRITLDTGVVELSEHRAFTQNAWASGGSGLVGNAAEFASLLEAVRNGAAPVTGELATELTRNQLTQGCATGRGPGWGFGLGPAVLTCPGLAVDPRNAGSWGWGGLYGSHFWVDPVARLTLVSLTNTAIAGLWGAFPEAILMAIYDSPSQSN